MKKVDANTVFGFWAKRNIDASLNALAARMDRSGIDRALTCSLRGFLYDFKEGNDQTQKVCAESKGRFIPVATINPQRYFGIIEEVERIIENGFKIVRFFPAEQEWTITQRHFTKLLEKLAETDLVLMIPSTEGISNIASVTGGMSNAILIETLRAYPILSEMIVCAQENPNLYIETHLVGSMDYIEVLVSEIGQKRIIFGSGAPLHCFSASILPIVNANISQEAKESIFKNNIHRLLGL